MRRYVPAAALIVLVLLATVPAAAKLDVNEKTTRKAIDDAFERGALSRAEMILQKAYSIYAPELLDPELAGGMTDKCGVPTIREIEEALPDLPEAIADEIRGLRARPDYDAYIDTEHFRIHYKTSGTHKILNWPDTTYRDAIATSAEYSWTREVDEMGFRQPPSDGSDPDGGDGGGLYDIYVQNLSGAYGYTAGCYTVPSTPQNDATSYIVIDNDYAGFGYADPQDPMKVTVAHEFNHACQYAHDYDEGLWYMECSAVWAEDMVYPTINDYVFYIPYFYNYPYNSLEWNDGTGLRVYGSTVWNHFLSEHIDPSVVPAIWYQCESTSSTYSMMDVVLATYGASLETEFRDFAVWNWFTGSRDDGAHYNDGALWAQVPTTWSYGAYPITAGYPPSGYAPDHMACNYLKFTNPGSGEDGLHITYDGPSTSSFYNFVYVNDLPSAGSDEEYGEMSLNAWGIGEITVSDWDSKDYVMLVIVNGDTGGDNMDYDFTVEQVDTGVGDSVFSLALKPASPNPFTQETSIAYTVPTGGGFVEVTVYDVSGREVRTLVSDRLGAGNGVAIWDGLDNGGRPVASGVYFARLDVDGLTASGKLIMMK